MAVLLRFLEPLIYPPPWSIINANSTENDVLSPSFLPCNEKIPHCNFFSKRHTNYLFFVHITNSQTFRFSIYRDFPRYRFSRAVFKYSPLWREKKERNERSKETKEGRKTKGERWTKEYIHGNDSFFFHLCFSLLHPSAVFRSIIGGPVREETLFVSLTREEEGSEEEVAATAYIVQGCLPVYSGMKESV